MQASPQRDDETKPEPAGPSGADWTSAPHTANPTVEKAALENPADSARDSLTLVIPAFNEALGLPGVLADLAAHCRDKVSEILIVDDGSSDATADLARRAGFRVISHAHNKGYGASLKTGIRASLTPYVIILDAEGQHHPSDVWRLWERRHFADMVVGARHGLGQSPLWRMPGKWLLTRMANHLVKRKIPDLNSGLRLFRKHDVSKYLHICPNGFSFTTTITMTFFSRGYSIDYIPIEVKPRQGKSTVTVGTGLDTLLLILRLASLFNPLRIFLPGSLLIAALGILWGLPYLLDGHGVSVGALLAFVTAIILFALGMICDQISQLRLERFE